MVSIGGWCEASRSVRTSGRKMLAPNLVTVEQLPRRETLQVTMAAALRALLQ